MKCSIADLFTRTHGENGLTRRREGSALNISVGESSGFRFLGSASMDPRCAMNCCLTASARRSLMLEPRKSGAQGAFTRCGDFATDRVIVTQVGRAQ
jgi:hypothetical protein